MNLSDKLDEVSTRLERVTEDDVAEYLLLRDEVMASISYNRIPYADIPMTGDTYYLNPEVAKDASRSGQRVDLEDGIVGDMICFCNDDTEYRAGALVSVPLGRLFQYFRDSFLRWPVRVCFTGTDISESDGVLLSKMVSLDLQFVDRLTRLRYHERVSARNRVVPIRDKIIIPISNYSNVLKHEARSLYHSFQKLGKEVLLLTDPDLMERRTYYDLADRIERERPGLVININKINNVCLSDKTMNLIWMQDFMRLDANEFDRLPLRKNDVVLSLLPEIDRLLSSKGIKSLRQSFCIDTSLFKLRDIERENKVIFIGSSYQSMVKNTPEIVGLIVQVQRDFADGVPFDNNYVIKTIENHPGLNPVYLHINLLPYIVRDSLLHWLCQESPIPVEVWGKGWDDYEAIRPFYKGVASYYDIPLLYNSARYAFCPHMLHIHQQRYYESAACGAIPVVYDVRGYAEGPFNESETLYFKTRAGLRDCLTKEITGDLRTIYAANTFDILASKIWGWYRVSKN